MAKIESIKAREILDSRGNPTLEVRCILNDESVGVAGVPSGASTGVHEALELRDGDKARYGGKGVLKAVSNVNETIANAIKGNDFDQKSLDEALIKLDGTNNKSNLGANAILGVSMAFAKACAVSQKIELYEYIAKISGEKIEGTPKPMLNVINGGAHADSGLDIQEFMIIPDGFSTAKERIQAGAEIISALKKILSNDGYSTGIGDEGGFAPKLNSNEQVLEYLTKAIVMAGYSTEKIKIALDVASSELYKDGKYELKIEGEVKKLSNSELVDWYKNLCEKYPIVSIEDGLSEDDWDGFAYAKKTLGDKVMIVGDDLTVTQVARIDLAKEKDAINAVLIKLNQVGSVTETIDSILKTKSYGWTPIISHRSGETSDTFISDLAVGTGSPYLKAGSLARGERVAKYNRILEIEENI